MIKSPIIKLFSHLNLIQNFTVLVRIVDAIILLFYFQQYKAFVRKISFTTFNGLIIAPTFQNPKEEASWVTVALKNSSLLLALELN